MKMATKSLFRPWKYPQNTSMLIINVQKVLIPWFVELITSLPSYRVVLQRPRQQEHWNLYFEVVSADMDSISSFPEGNPEGQQVRNDLGQLRQVHFHLSNGAGTATKCSLKFMFMLSFQPWELLKPFSSPQEFSQPQETILYVIKTWEKSELTLAQIWKCSHPNTKKLFLVYIILRQKDRLIEHFCSSCYPILGLCIYILTDLIYFNKTKKELMPITAAKEHISSLKTFFILTDISLKKKRCLIIWKESPLLKSMWCSEDKAHRDSNTGTPTRLQPNQGWLGGETRQGGEKNQQKPLYVILPPIKSVREESTTQAPTVRLLPDEVKLR